jgi:CTP:molybdopterin cytidylyltransferase MocA
VSLCAVVLAAGRGERLRPLTDKTPKPLLEVGGRTLLDAALDRVATVLPGTPTTVAVNAHWLADQVVAAVAGRAHLSVEQPAALGTAGAIGRLKAWVGGRDVLVTNGDAWFDRALDLTDFVAAWSGDAPRLLVVEDAAAPDFDGRWRFAGVALLPAGIAAAFRPMPAGLYEAVWSRMPVDLVPTEATYIDCGTRERLARARALAAAQP